MTTQVIPSQEYVDNTSYSLYKIRSLSVLSRLSLRENMPCDEQEGGNLTSPSCSSHIFWYISLLSFKFSRKKVSISNTLHFCDLSGRKMEQRLQLI
jgi:hypothetical protein